MQISLFDGNKKFENNKPIRLIELFAGIGSQAQALKELGVDFKHHKIVEFDKYAIKSYNAIHNTSFEVQDITKINADELEIIETDKYNYIMTYSFPCQDLSLAGQGAGMAKGSGTRSGLLWEVERLLLETKEKPQILLMENVPEVIGIKNMPHFAEWIKALEEMGYKNYWENLKATDFGIPQSRNRTFMISILGDYYYSFPKPIKLEYLLKDMLETSVDEKYYLSDKLFNYHIKRNNDNGHFEKFNPKKKEDAEIARTIHNTGLNRTDDNFIAEPKIQEQSLKQQLANKIIESGRVKEYDIIRHSYSNSRMEGKREIAESNNLSPTLDTRCDCLGVVEPQLIGGFGEKKSNGNTQWYQQDRVYDSNAVSLSVTTSFHTNYAIEQDGAYGYYSQQSENFTTPPLKDLSRTLKANKHDASVIENLRIRKLTPKECFRLMGFRDELFDKAEKTNSNSQLYKQAGNSIVTTVLMAIFGELLGVNWKSRIEQITKKLIN